MEIHHIYCVARLLYIYIHNVAFAEVNTYSGHKCSDSMIAQDRTHDAVQGLIYRLLGRRF